jgi:hypothetical protein
MATRQETFEALEALIGNEREISQLRAKVYHNINQNENTYQRVLENNLSLHVTEKNVNEFARNLWVLQKLGGNIEGVITPTRMGMPHQWLRLFGVIGFFVSLPLMLAGFAMIELLYVGIVLFVLSILAMIIYSQKFGSKDNLPRNSKHFCVMDLRIKPDHFYKVFYSGSDVSPTLVKIWKYKYDNSFALNHQKEEGDFMFNEQGNIVPELKNPPAHSGEMARLNASPGQPHDPSEDPFAHSGEMAQENNDHEPPSENHVPSGENYDIQEDTNAKRIYEGYKPNVSESDPRFIYAMINAVHHYRGIQDLAHKNVMTYERAFIQFMIVYRKTYIRSYPHFYTYLDKQ